jgi:hypothetical protein
MGTYTFSYKSDMADGVDVAVRFEDSENPHISHVIGAFEQFLLGCTFQPETIKKYVDVEAAQVDIRRLVLDGLRAKHCQNWGAPCGDMDTTDGNPHG